MQATIRQPIVEPIAGAEAKAEKATWYVRAATILMRSIQSFGSDKCATMSAAIAYYTVFSLFPMALVGVSLLGFFLDDESARRQVVQGLANVILLGDAGEAALAVTLQGVARQRGLLGIVGLLTAIWSASGLFGAIRSALNSVWDVDRPRPMLRAKVVDFFLFIGFGGLLFISAASTGLLQGIRDAKIEWLRPLLELAAPIFWLVAILAPLSITFAAFMFLYKVAPHARLSWRDVLPSAVIAALFFEFGKVGLAFYIRSLGNFNALAGSLGAAILFLVFVYYASQVVLFAAELSKHWLLVNEGALPAVDLKPKGPKRSFVQSIRQTVISLWTLGEPHHDRDLPYEPGRIEPGTRLPRDTREEVLLKQKESFEKAQAGKGASDPPGDKGAGEKARSRPTRHERGPQAQSRGRHSPSPQLATKPEHRSSGIFGKLSMQLVGLVALALAFVLSRLDRGRKVTR